MSKNKTLEIQLKELKHYWYQSDILKHNEQFKTLLVEKNVSERSILQSQSGKFYSLGVRLSTYTYNQLICYEKIVAILGKKDIDSVPCHATCSQMAYEWGVLSTLHMMEFMLSQSSL